MRGFPWELLYVLVFVGLLLVQYLLKRFASRSSSRNGPAPQPPADEPAAPARRTRGLPLPPPQSPAPPHPPVRSEVPAPRRPPPRRRFARTSLLGTRRDAQNAVVIATIIGPCRALEPPGEPTNTFSKREPASAR